MNTKNPYIICCLLISGFLISGCSNKHKLMTVEKKSSAIEVQGHRGCRGLMPENTLVGFKHALDLGVNILELDVVISKDKAVIVSHEAFFNHELVDKIDGVLVTSENEKSFNIYQMNAAQIQAIDVGSKANARFPTQKKLKTYKPLLGEVIAQCDAYAAKKGYPLPFYNIEIKRDKSLDNLYNPEAKAFVSLVDEVIKQHDLNNRYNIQSFDHETLNVYHTLSPKTPLAILVGDTLGFKHHLDLLNHVPYAYSPYFQLVNEKLVTDCKSANLRLIPWTVNDRSWVIKLAKMKVDGIITDFPDMVIETLKNLE